MTLSEYLAGNGITYREFAATLGRDSAEVWRWAKGQRTPDLRTAIQIEALTAGAVQPASFVTGNAV